jgi:hypothetical protein
METAILLGLIGIGYLQKEKNRDEAHPEIVPNINTPTHNSVYDQNNYTESKNVEKILAENMIENMNKSDTNIVDVNSITNNSHRLTGLNEQMYDGLENREIPSADGIGLQSTINNGEHVSEYVYSQSLGAYVKSDDFLTNDNGINNGVPFISGTNSQAPLNYDDVSTLEAHQGGNSAKYYGGKREMPQMFQPTPEDIYGNKFVGPMADQNRYIPGQHRTGELPFEQERIQPIDVKSELNREIDLAIAKTRSIDTLRTLTNQKHTYEGRVIEGEHINRRGVQAPVDKNAPYRDYKNTPERYFTTATDVKASTVRSKEILPFTNRQYLNRTLLGHAAPQNGKSAEEKRPEVFKGLKQQLGVQTERNVVGEVPANIDHERLGYEAYPNERDVTVERTYEGNVKTYIPENELGLQDPVRKTKKETTIELNHNGIAGTTVSQDVSRQAELNSDTNPTKEIIAQGREPTLSNVKLWEGKESMNIDIKKLDSDYMTQYQTGLTKVYTKLSKDNSCELTRDKFQLDDADLLIEQINPDLLNPFRENPYTHSLASASMA